MSLRLQILVTPDLKAMDQAIKNHVAEHEAESKSSENILSPELLEQYLAEQVLMMTLNEKPSMSNDSWSVATCCKQETDFHKLQKDQGNNLVKQNIFILIGLF